MACLPATTRSTFPSFLTAAARVVDVAQVSAPAKALSERSSAESAPREMASRRIASAWGGPMVRAMTSPPRASLQRRPSSSAYASKGFMMAGTPSRMSVPRSGSILTSDASGTCFRAATILIRYFLSFDALSRMRADAITPRCIWLVPS